MFNFQGPSAQKSRFSAASRLSSPSPFSALSLERLTIISHSLSFVKHFFQVFSIFSHCRVPAAASIVTLFRGPLSRALDYLITRGLPLSTVFFLFLTFSSHIFPFPLYIGSRPDPLHNNTCGASRFSRGWAAVLPGKLFVHKGLLPLLSIIERTDKRKEVGTCGGKNRNNWPCGCGSCWWCCW